MLKVKLLDPRATVPTVAHPTEDLAYDLFALEDVTLQPCVVTKVRTGVAVEASVQNPVLPGEYWGKDRPAGLLIRDRSSMAAKGITVSGGVIDAGYRGEIVVMLTAQQPERVDYVSRIIMDRVVSRDVVVPYTVKAGDKIAQMIPVPVLTGKVEVVEELSSASRGEKSFGSSGR